MDTKELVRFLGYFTSSLLAVTAVVRAFDRIVNGRKCREIDTAFAYTALSTCSMANYRIKKAQNDDERSSGRIMSIMSLFSALVFLLCSLFSCDDEEKCSCD